MAKQESFLMHTMDTKCGGFLFKDGADLRMESFSCNQSLHSLSLGVYGFFDDLPFHVEVDVFVFFNFLM